MKKEETMMDTELFRRTISCIVSSIEAGRPPVPDQLCAYADELTRWRDRINTSDKRAKVMWLLARGYTTRKAASMLKIPRHIVLKYKGSVQPDGAELTYWRFQETHGQSILVLLKYVLSCRESISAGAKNKGLTRQAVTETLRRIFGPNISSLLKTCRAEVKRRQEIEKMRQEAIKLFPYPAAINKLFKRIRGLELASKTLKSSRLLFKYEGNLIYLVKGHLSDDGMFCIFPAAKDPAFTSGLTACYIGGDRLYLFKSSHAMKGLVPVEKTVIF